MFCFKTENIDIFIRTLKTFSEFIEWGWNEETEIMNKLIEYSSNSDYVEGILTNLE